MVVAMVMAMVAACVWMEATVMVAVMAMVMADSMAVAVDTSGGRNCGCNWRRLGRGLLQRCRAEAGPTRLRDQWAGPGRAGGHRLRVPRGRRPWRSSRLELPNGLRQSGRRRELSNGKA